MLSEAPIPLKSIICDCPPVRNSRLASMARALYYSAIPVLTLGFTVAFIVVYLGSAAQSQLEPLGASGASELAAWFLIVGFSLIIGAAYLRRAASNPAYQTEPEPMIRTEPPTQKAPEQVPTPAEEVVAPYELTKLDMYILRSPGAIKDESALARASNVDVEVITRKIALLTKNGYITTSRELTEKGFLAVNEESGEPHAIQREKEILTREVVRIPCRHCGSLVDQTLARCPSCGAPLVR
jgi:hypothetical protein